MSKQIDLEKLHAAATHAQVHGYLLKWDGSEIRNLVDRLSALEKDAARYQMMRNNVEALDTRDICIFDRDGWEIHGLLQGDELDQEIDTAMEASNEKAD